MSFLFYLKQFFSTVLYYDFSCLSVCLSVTNVGVAVMDLRVVCKIITCVSAFTFTAEEVRQACALRHYFYIPRPHSHIKLYIEYDFNYMKGARRHTDVVPPLRLQNKNYRNGHIIINLSRDSKNCCKAAAAGLDTLHCRLREGCHCGRLPSH